MKELEKLAADAPVLAGRVEKLKAENRDLSEQVETLKELVEAASGAEAMVEELGAQKMRLEDRVAELSATVEDLESLRELNEELEENHLATEKQLQDEADFKDTLVRQQQVLLAAAQETSAQYEDTISKFRELVAHLQAESEASRSAAGGATSSSATNELPGQSAAMESLKLELQTTNAKAQAKAIALELRRLDAEQATEHLALVRGFLPEVFFEQEHDPIRAMLALRRVAFKAALVLKHIEQAYRFDQGFKNGVAVEPAELVVACQLRARLAAIHGVAQRLWLFMQLCAPPEYLKAGRVFSDVQSVERKLDVFVEVSRCRSCVSV